MTSLSDIHRACERVRRLPEARWHLAPLPPLGSRAPLAAVDTTGETLEAQVRRCVTSLMQADAQVRGVRSFDIDVHVFALPDVLEALARSVNASDDLQASRVLEEVAQQSRSW